MAIPVVALDEGKTILARPRNQPIYDTEGTNNAVALPTTLTFFQNLAQFQVANLNDGPAKVFGRDTNLEGTPGGTIPKGSIFLCYDLTTPQSFRSTDLSTGANCALFEEVQRLRRAYFLTFKFADTPYFSEQLECIPQGVGINEVMTTSANGGPGVNIFAIKNGRLDRDNRRRMTVAGYPVVLTQNEQFSIVYGCYSDFQPTVTAEIYWTPTLHGLFIKGLQG